MQELTQRLNELCDAQPWKTFWYLKDLRTGKEADRDGHVEVTSASTRKISIMMAALNQVAKGNLSLDDPFTIEEQDQKNQSGCFFLFRPGFTVTLYDGILMMIIVSDNTCTGKIVNLIGLDQLNEYCRSVGMTKTTHRFNVPRTWDTPLDHPLEASNSTTAYDVGQLLDKMVAGTKDPDVAEELGVTPELCQVAIDIMLQQKLGKLADQIPPEGKVAHKGGTGRRMANDCGIIYKNGEPQFVLSVYVDGPPREKMDGPGGRTAARAHVANLCRTSWDALVDGKPV